MILHRERANKISGKRRTRLLIDLHHDSSFLQVRRCGKSSSATQSPALRPQDRLRSVSAVRLPKGKDTVRTLSFNSVLIMFSEIMIILCFAASMIELFMLDLVVFMINLFQNLIIKLPNYSTVVTAHSCDI